jgi:hypothetical protein
VVILAFILFHSSIFWSCWELGLCYSCYPSSIVQLQKTWIVIGFVLIFCNMLPIRMMQFQVGSTSFLLESLLIFHNGYGNEYDWICYGLDIGWSIWRVCSHSSSFFMKKKWPLFSIFSIFHFQKCLEIVLLPVLFHFLICK